MANYPVLTYLDAYKPTAAEMNGARTLVFGAANTSFIQLGYENEATFYESGSGAILRDLFKVTLTAGNKYFVASSSYFDPFILSIHDLDGNFLEVDSGTSYGIDSLSYTAPYTGTYYVNASWNQGSASVNKFVSVSVYEDVLAIANQAPTLAGLLSSAQGITVGTSAPLADFTVADADNNNLTLTLTPTNGVIGGLTDANPSLPGIQLTGAASSINSALAGASFTATSAGTASIAISVTDGVVTAPTTGSYNFTAAAANQAPTLAGLPTSIQSITAGTSAALVDFTVADADNNNLTLTLTPTNGVIGGLTDANPTLAGIQLAGTASSINTALAGASFNATAVGSASIAISVTDGVVSTPTTGSYNFTAASGNVNLTGSAGNDNLRGGTENDTLDGLAGNDQLTGLGGNDAIKGGDGIDTAVYTGAKSSHTIARNSSGFTVASTLEGTDTLESVERLAFSDRKVAFDLGGNAGSAALIMGALLGKASLQNKSLVGTVIGLIDGGQTLADLSQTVVSNGVVASLAGGNGNDPFVRLILRNVTGDDSNAGLVSSLTGLLDNGFFTKASLLTIAAGLDLNKVQIDFVGLSATGLDYV